MGDNYYLGDRNGVRTPMQWDSDKNAGFSKIDSRDLFLPIITEPTYHYEAVNVENSEKNPDSLLSFFKQLIAIRKKLQSLSKGTFTIIQSNNTKILSFIRTYEEERLLVVINLSKNVQAFKLYFSEYYGYELKDVFGNTTFPTIGKEPYNMNISPLSFYWLLLDKKNIRTSEKIEIVYRKNKNDDVEFFEKKLLTAYLKEFHSLYKTLTFKEIEIINVIDISEANSKFYFFKVYYNEDLPEFYSAFISSKKIFDLNYLDNIPKETILITVNDENEKEVFFDGFSNRDLRSLLFENLIKSKNIKVKDFGSSLIKEVFINNSNSWLINSLTKNYLINYGNKVFFKLYKSFEFGSRPEIELINFLTKKGFKQLPVISNVITYNYKNEKAEIGLIQEYIVNEGNFFDYSTKELERFYSKILLQTDKSLQIKNLALLKENIKQDIGIFYLNLIKKLAERTAEMHILLASEPKDEFFYPEHFNFMYQRSVYQTVRTELKKTIENIAYNIDYIKQAELETISQSITNNSLVIINYIKKILSKNLDGLRIRNHGEFALNQILFTGKDFVFVDFDGISIRPFSERKIKRSSLREVAFLLRSFHYASYSTFINDNRFKSINTDKFNILPEIWYEIVTQTFLESYFEKLEGKKIIPQDKKDSYLLLNILLLNKLFSSVNYEIRRKSKNLIIPLIGINNILKNIEGEQNEFDYSK